MTSLHKRHQHLLLPEGADQVRGKGRIAPDQSAFSGMAQEALKLRNLTLMAIGISLIINGNCGFRKDGKRSNRTRHMLALTARTCSRPKGACVQSCWIGRSFATSLPAIWLPICFCTLMIWQDAGH